jgi:uncharacterized membrane protein (DUF2068 family)
MASESRYWFAATPFGLGWWRPSHWLGWLSVLAAIVLAFVAGKQFPPSASPLYFSLSITVIVVVFLLVCKIKGEPLGRARA